MVARFIDNHIICLFCLRGKLMKKRIRNKLNKRNREELVHAIYEGHIRKVRLLVRCKTDADYKDQDGWTPLHWATQECQMEIIQYLLFKGANINSKDNNGFSPLYQAASEGRIKLVDFLIDKGAEIDIRSSNGTTPLIIASCYGHLESVKYLVGKGADINVKEDKGNTALSFAVQYGNEKVALFLKEQS
ncbi:ankyrin repeat domain-containing protein [Metabacillus idriensis]|nr:ankyrin repeat domain-containing protein [Metabacillus idriensis]MDR0140170.1 ankyrin repeat domain-containing protein [Metabacillus idriensis]